MTAARPAAIRSCSSRGAPCWGISTSRQVSGSVPDRLEVGGQRAQQVVERLRDLLQRPSRLAFHERFEQPAEVVEVPVDDRPGDAGFASHPLDRDGLEAMLDDDRLGHVQQLLAPLRAHSSLSPLRW